MNGFLLWVAMVIQPPGTNQTVGWQLGAEDGKLELIVHISPGIVAQMSSPENELEVPLPDVVSGKFERMIVRISDLVPERELTEAELAYLPVSQPNLTKLGSSPGFAQIDPQSPMRNRDVAQASLGDVPQDLNPPSLPVGSNNSLGASDNSLRNRDSGIPTTMSPVPNPRDNVPLSTPLNSNNAFNNSNLNGNSFGAPSSFDNGIPGSFPNPAPSSSFSSIQPPATSPLLNNGTQYTAAPNAPSTMSSFPSQRQPSFGSSLPNDYSQSNFNDGFQSPGLGMNNASAMGNGNLLRVADNTLGSDLNRMSRSQAPPLGMSTNPAESSNTWYFPLFFLISFVVNIYCIIYLVKLRERYRALLAGARAGIDLGSSAS